jgi:hypothetical protein
MFEAFSHAVKMGFLANDPSSNVSLQAVLDGCVGKLLEALRDETDLTARACGAGMYHNNSHNNTIYTH